MNIKTKLAVAALLAVGLSSAAAYADSVTFTLTNPTGYINVTGGSVTFDATVSAAAGNSGAIFLNGDSFNATAPLTLDDSDFFSDFPLSLAPGASFTGPLFELTLPPGSPFGTFLGTFSLLGGANGSASNTLDTADFTLITTPEPSSVVLLLTGLVMLLWVGFKRNVYNWAR